ncbi:MAG: integrase arm-type DNA-binding domain-containing protein, partial [Pseudomonadota bacterium]
MAREIKKLTDAEIKNKVKGYPEKLTRWHQWAAAEKKAKETGKPNDLEKPKKPKKLLSDGDGLYLALTKNGTASWVLIYRMMKTMTGGKNKGRRMV